MLIKPLTIQLKVIQLIGRFITTITGIILLVSLVGCSSSKKTIKKNITLSGNYYESVNSDLLIKIPSGWNEIKDNSEKLFDFWLVSPDRNSAIVFVPVYFNSKDKLLNDRITLEFLSETTKKLKQNTNQNFYILNDIPTYKINSFWFNGFMYKIDSNERKSVLFGSNNKFYECIAYFNEEYNPTKNELENLFKVQKLVLSTVQIK
jgi:hypothetical protein